MEMRWLVLAVLLLQGGFVHAQTFNEWFRQKSTQRKYLIQQIAALEVYKDYVKKGYKIVNGGLDFIRDMRNGDFDLHKDYFGSLGKVNPKIKRSAKVAKCIDLQIRIVQRCARNMKALRASGRLNDAEISYLGTVFNRLLDDCALALDELLQLISNGQLEMRDDERLQRIERIYEAMERQNAFAHDFGREALMLAAAKETEHGEILRMRDYYGINE